MKKNVLLVEDDPALRMVMREVLKDEFEIEEAANGQDGIDRGLNTHADLVILDYHLPKKNGLQVIEALKNAHPDIPVIVLSGFLNPESEARFSSLGANKIFPKPFNYRNLLETVRSLVQPSPAANGLPEPAHTEPTTSDTATGTVESQILSDSLETIAHLAEKVEFLQSLSEKYWIDPDDISAMRETARCMNSELQKFYGKTNHALFSNGQFDSPVIAQAKRPSLSGNN